MRPNDLIPFPPKGRGFTLVEIIIASAIVVITIASVSILLVQFKRSFTKGEESTVIIQEGGMFLAMLRNDFINAVLDKDMSADAWTQAIRTQPESLSFQIFRDAGGTIEPVIYVFDKAVQGEGGTISRTQGGGRPKMLVDRHVASLTWRVETDVIPGTATGVRQIWLNIDIVLGGQGKPGLKSKVIQLSTKLFPTRLNRQINSTI